MRSDTKASANCVYYFVLLLIYLHVMGCLFFFACLTTYNISTMKVDMLNELNIRKELDDNSIVWLKPRYEQEY